jgi:hypothetical protein
MLQSVHEFKSREATMSKLTASNRPIFIHHSIRLLFISDYRIGKCHRKRFSFKVHPRHALVQLSKGVLTSSYERSHRGLSALCKMSTSKLRRRNVGSLRLLRRNTCKNRQSPRPNKKPNRASDPTTDAPSVKVWYPVRSLQPGKESRRKNFD